MAMKIASRKKKIPSIAKAIPKASPKRSIIPGHSSPNSKERTVPLTAPTANRTATAFDQRRARERHAEAGEDDVEGQREGHLVAGRQQVRAGVRDQGGEVRHRALPGR